MPGVLISDVPSRRAGSTFPTHHDPEADTTRPPGRASEADRRAAEATGLFAVSRLLATADRTEAVAGQMVELLADNTGLERVWIGVEGGAHERVLADTGTGPVPAVSIITTLVRMPG